MDSSACQIMLTSLILSDDSNDNGKDRRNGREWVREMYRERKKSGQYVKLVQKLASTDPIMFRNYMRMSPERFEDLLGIVGPAITKQEYICEPIAAKERLALTIRFLASGDMQTSLAYNYLCLPATVHNIIKETSEAIWKNLRPTVFPALTTEFFKSVADGFEQKWNFPNCMGAVDGKHVTMQAPSRSGSEFFNYKKNHSIVLMAICDHNYSFISCDIGAAGRQSDGGIFRNSEFGKKVLSENMNFPQPRTLTDRHENLPYVFLADDAFPLTTHIMKPFSGQNLTTDERIFNYRLCRGRRMIENAFGILAAVWRIFRKPICAKVETVHLIIGACVCLHNWLRINPEDSCIFSGLEDTENSDGSMRPGEWRNQENNFTPFRSGMYNSSEAAKKVRYEFADFFSNEGAVEWQWEKM